MPDIVRNVASIFFIDIAVPRDIDPKLMMLKMRTCSDHLQEIVQANLAQRSLKRKVSRL
jgi:glutamyl-tRNA reductase